MSDQQTEVCECVVAGPSNLYGTFTAQRGITSLNGFYRYPNTITGAEGNHIIYSICPSESPAQKVMEHLLRVNYKPQELPRISEKDTVELWTAMYFVARILALRGRYAVTAQKIIRLLTRSS